jgi:hypothetical protein
MDVSRRVAASPRPTGIHERRLWAVPFDLSTAILLKSLSDPARPHSGCEPGLEDHGSAALSVILFENVAFNVGLPRRKNSSYVRATLGHRPLSSLGECPASLKERSCM